MKMRVKSPFFDSNGLHKKGDIIETTETRPELVEPVIEEKKVEKKIEAEVKKTTSKVTRKKV